MRRLPPGAVTSALSLAGVTEPFLSFSVVTTSLPSLLVPTTPLAIFEFVTASLASFAEVTALVPKCKSYDIDALTEALREMFSTGGLGKRVRVGIANQRTVMRTIDLPPVTDRKELASAVRFCMLP